jgi:hypothetical protein
VVTVASTQQNHIGEGHVNNSLMLPAVGDFLPVFAGSVFVRGALWTRTRGGSNNHHVYSIQKTAPCGFIISGLTDSLGVGESVPSKPSGASVLNGPVVITEGEAETVGP